MRKSGVPEELLPKDEEATVQAHPECVSCLARKERDRLRKAKSDAAKRLKGLMP